MPCTLCSRIPSSFQKYKQYLFIQYFFNLLTLFVWRKKKELHQKKKIEYLSTQIKIIFLQLIKFISMVENKNYQEK